MKKFLKAALVIFVLIFMAIGWNQHNITIKAMNAYLEEKYIEEEDIDEYTIIKDYKTARHGYSIGIRYKDEEEHVYQYYYDTDKFILYLIGVYEQEYSVDDGLGGDEITITDSNLEEFKYCSEMEIEKLKSQEPAEYPFSLKNYLENIGKSGCL